MPSLRNRRVYEQTTDMVKKRKIEAVPDVKVEDNGSDSNDSDSDIENYMAKANERREENIRLNQEFLRQFGIQQAREDLLAASKSKPKPPTKRGLKREVVVLPRRSSLRLQKKSPEGLELPPESLIAAVTSYQPDTHQRPPDGPLQMRDYLYKTTSTEDHEHLVKIFKSVRESTLKPSTVELDRYTARLNKLSINEFRVAKVVPERVFSVAIHPCENKVLVATGDKWGKLGFWDMESTGDAGFSCYAPHSRPITGLEFPAHFPHRVYTCGYDGSMRCGDINKEVFEEVYSIPEEEDVLLRNFSWTSPHTMLVAQNDGCVALVDIRTDKTTAEHKYELHMKSMRTVSCHPVDTHVFCTASVDTTVGVWDLRKVSARKNKPICSLPHGRNLNSAYFSPVTGKYILSTSMNDTLTIFDTSVIGSNIKTKKSIAHNNHTGRWLTPFRASWHPVRDDVFIVGSMNRPREISVFGVDGKKLRAFKDAEYLGSVCSLNAIHPSRDIVVGGNSSGRLHVFM